MGLTLSTKNGTDYPDSSILDLTRELAVQLSLSDPGLEEVVWKNIVGTGRGARELSSDRCEFWSRKLVLPARMEDLLSVDEWRPIIASALVYRNLYSTSTRKRAPYLLVPLISFIALAVVLAFLTRTLVYSALLFFAYFLVIIPVLRSNTRLNYQTSLEADRKAASVVGKEAFLGVLHKIDSLKLADVEKAKKPGFDRRRAVNPTPNIADRIANLEATAA